jgi:polyhydroxyalkanoate synthesis regulator phasin
MLEEMRKYIEAAVESLSPSKAQRLARSLVEPGARKDQVSKLAQELVEWSQRNRERLREFVSREVKDQLRGMGVATQSEVDALKKRVRELERASGTASGRRKAAAKPKAGARAKARTATSGTRASG